jgi:hypothetical protein
LIFGDTSSTAASPCVDSPVATVAGNRQPWRPFIPDPGAHGHWLLNARNALDSGRTGERSGLLEGSSQEAIALNPEALVGETIGEHIGRWLLYGRSLSREALAPGQGRAASAQDQRLL